ncbi:MAG: hypothetical protein NEA02_05265 [Thermoanaerobaculia bacterium]|nr:hypothetical protein [Thermoanaerobaculia bacterium]
MRAGRAFLLCLLGCCNLARPAVAQAEDRTPRAGEAFTGSVFGRTVDVPARDRTRVTELWAALQFLPSGPESRTLVPQAALVLWRSRNGGEERVRAVLLGIYDDVRWNRKLDGTLESVLTFENTALPWARSEFVEGRRIASEELQWSVVRAGVGLGTRFTIAPSLQDNAVEAALTYEPGVLFFRRGSDTSESFQPPSDAYEGRVHGRVRADAFERNLLELPHGGFGAGLDAFWAHRAGWRDWGGGPSGPHAADGTRSWSAISGYALAALPVPFVSSERHRLLVSAYGGAGSNLDRFSTLRLSGGSNAGDFESLSQPILPAAAFDEIATRGYGILNLEYRFEALFFLFLHARGTLARADRLRSDAQGRFVSRADWLNGVTVGLTSGFLWSSTIELFVSRNFGLESESAGVFSAGRNAAYVSFTKSF